MRGREGRNSEMVRKKERWLRVGRSLFFSSPSFSFLWREKQTARGPKCAERVFDFSTSFRFLLKCESTYVGRETLA